MCKTIGVFSPAANDEKKMTSSPRTLAGKYENCGMDV